MAEVATDPEVVAEDHHHPGTRVPRERVVGERYDVDRIEIDVGLHQPDAEQPIRPHGSDFRGEQEIAHHREHARITAVRGAAEEVLGPRDLLLETTGLSERSEAKTDVQLFL